MWRCKECGETYYEDCSPYYVICLNCGNEGNEMEDIAEWVEEQMKEFFIRLGATIFYTMVLLLILGGGSINGYKIKGIIKILIDMFK